MSQQSLSAKLTEMIGYYWEQTGSRPAVIRITHAHHAQLCREMGVETLTHFADCRIDACEPIA